MNDVQHIAPIDQKDQELLLEISRLLSRIFQKEQEIVSRLKNEDI